MTSRRLAAAAALALLAGACSGTADPPLADPSVSSATTGVPGPAVDWLDPNTRITFDETGLTVSACQGDALMLCVEEDGQTIGSVEATSYPLESFGGLDPSADPNHNLGVFADTFFTSFEADRSQGCGADYGFEPIGPETFDLGGHPGVSFGFIGTNQDGTASELNLQYATVVGDMFLSITAIAYDDNGCPGRDELSGFRSGELQRFRPDLEELLRRSPLPPVGA